MAKKEFGDALRRTTKKKKKLPIDISVVESIKKQDAEVKVEPTPLPLPKKTARKTIRTSFNLPADIHEEMLQHCFKLRISMKDYLVGLVKKDRNLK